jgi:hypothetical protein
VKQPIGKCVQCGKPKRLPKKYPVSRQHYVEDEFCSRLCCEAFHEIEEKSGRTALYVEASV